MFDVLGRITELKEERGWTTYRMAKNAGIGQSTLLTWYARKRNPPIDAIEKICKAFGITMSEFFEEKRDGEEETPLLQMRKKVGMSMDDLAEKSGVAMEHIFAYEQRRRDIRNAPYREIEALAKVLGCPIEEIVEMK